MKRLPLYAALLVLSVLPAACNTFEGMGQDIKAAGQALTNGASDTKQGIDNATSSH